MANLQRAVQGSGSVVLLLGLVISAICGFRFLLFCGSHGFILCCCLLISSRRVLLVSVLGGGRGIFVAARGG